MRSKIFQKVLDDFNSKPFYIKWKILIRVEFTTFKTLGFKKYSNFYIKKIKNYLNYEKEHL